MQVFVVMWLLNSMFTGIAEMDDVVGLVGLFLLLLLSGDKVSLCILAKRTMLEVSLQSHCNKNCMIFTQKQMGRKTE